MTTSVEKAVKKVIEKEPKTGRTYARISNQELTGRRPQTDLEKMGLDVLAKELRDKVAPIIEEEHGIALIPDDYRGTWRIVPVEERASHVILKKLEKIERQQSQTRTAIEYYTMLAVSDEFTQDMIELLDDLDYLDKTYEKIVKPSAAKMKDKLLPWQTEDDEPS